MNPMTDPQAVRLGLAEALQEVGKAYLRTGMAVRDFDRAMERIGDLENELERAREAEKAPTWQPIATAPRSGVILVYIPAIPGSAGEDVAPAYWSELAGKWLGFTHRLADAEPTHWLPILPVPGGRG